MNNKFITLRNALESIIDAEIGIYPAAVTIDGVTTPRDKYGDGWNDCKMRHTKLIWDAIEKIEKEENFNQDLELLLLAEVGWLRDGKLFLNMNDTFAYAYADAECVPAEKISEVASLFRRFGGAGLTYWVSEQRKEIPHIKKHAYDVEYVKNRISQNY